MWIRRCPFNTITLIFLGFLAGLGTPGYSQGIKEPPRPSKIGFQRSDLTAIDEAPLSTDPNFRLKRYSKNVRYNKPGGKSLLNTIPENGSRIVYSERYADDPPLPFGLCSVVLIGKIEAEQPYLSQDESDLYTEYRIRVEEVFKDDRAQKILPGALIDVDCVGGALRLKSGRILRVYANLPRRPHPGDRCLLFLKSIHDNQDLQFYREYIFDQGLVSPLEEDAAGRRYADYEEHSFLDLVRKSATKK